MSITPAQHRILKATLDLHRYYPQGVTPRDVAEQIDAHPGPIGVTMSRLRRDGMLELVGRTITCVYRVTPQGKDAAEQQATSTATHGQI